MQKTNKKELYNSQFDFNAQRFLQNYRSEYEQDPNLIFRGKREPKDFVLLNKIMCGVRKQDRLDRDKEK